MSDHICPRCGRNDSQVAFIDAFCVDCYQVKLVVPPKLEMLQCKRCGMMHLKGEWMPRSERKIADYIVSKCKGEFERAEYDVERQMLTAFIVKGGNELKVERPVLLDVTITTCPRCSRMSGGYFEGIIQLRGDRKKVEKAAANILKRLEKKTFISKTDELDEGIDIYAGSSKAVVALMGELGFRTLISKKLVGRDEGKQLYRTTFLVRL